jgi:hypothetical protein
LKNISFQFYFCFRSSACAAARFRKKNSLTVKENCFFFNKIHWYIKRKRASKLHPSDKRKSVDKRNVKNVIVLIIDPFNRFNPLFFFSSTILSKEFMVKIKHLFIENPPNIKFS